MRQAVKVGSVVPCGVFCFCGSSSIGVFFCFEGFGRGDGDGGPFGCRCSISFACFALVKSSADLICKEVGRVEIFVERGWVDGVGLLCWTSA